MNRKISMKYYQYHAEPLPTLEELELAHPGCGQFKAKKYFGSGDAILVCEKCGVNLRLLLDAQQQLIINAFVPETYPEIEAREFFEKTFDDPLTVIWNIKSFEQ